MASLLCALEICNILAQLWKSCGFRIAKILQTVSMAVIDAVYCTCIVRQVTSLQIVRARLENS